MWLDCIIMLPVIFLGLEKLVYEKVNALLHITGICNILQLLYWNNPVHFKRSLLYSPDCTL